MNLVKIDFDRCKECGYCIKFCPKGVLSKGTKVNKKGYYPPVVGEGCIACGTCAGSARIRQSQCTKMSEEAEHG